ncbi:type VI secretion system tube protein Hcp [Opitutia bacterium ISCC 51]|nr:type VI secretion system tube protein Hcp [Opitutae bacterium ISCC 51]QXD27710.1 type VI secretion system tube protein Hcp [Opitutae bacterium ISCC 52]
MKTKHFLRCIFVLVLTPFWAQGAAFLKFDGVDGESKDKDHKGWIDIESIS